jgi:hypothetical protein
MGLRIYHNGDVRNGNPHWHLWFHQNGYVWGEVFCYQTIRRVEDQLSESEAKTMFETADMMKDRFSLSRHLETDDICVQCNEEGERIYSYLVPPADQDEESVAGFFAILKRLVEKHKPTT